VDISGLEEVDQAIHVQDLRLDEGITVLDHPEQIIFRISEQFVEKEEEEAVGVEAEAVEGAEAAAEEQPSEESSEG
jgi:hypothetical protein